MVDRGETTMKIMSDDELYARACKDLERHTEACGFIYNQPSRRASERDPRTRVITLRDNSDRVLARYRHDEWSNRLRRMADR
jgi:hypothetical protein